MKQHESSQEKYLKDVLKENQSVSKELVTKHLKLENELKRLGVNTDPQFRLEPPLGFSRLRLFNR